MAEKMTVLYDASKCTGCQACSVACKQWNELPGEKSSLITSYQSRDTFTPKTWTFMSFKETYENKKNEWLFRKQQCMHCTDAACEKACNYNAISHTDKGFVVIDHDKCIGCGYCAANCTFNIPRVDKTVNKSMKCTGCVDRVGKGLKPACITTCQPNALVFGERKAVLAVALERVSKLKETYPKANLYGATELNGLNYSYVLLREPEFYGLPANPSVPISIGLWKMFVRPGGGLAIAGALGMVGLATFMNYRGGSKDHHDKDGHGKGGHHV